MPKLPEVEGHWHSLIEGFATSSLDFYTLVQANLARREIPDLKISQVEWKESGFASGKRVYLRISRERFNFDICAAPFGTGYFFSWWLAPISRVFLDLVCLLGLLLGGYLEYLFFNAGHVFEQGCMGVLLFALLFFSELLVLGIIVRKGDLGIEPTVISMPVTGFLYRFVFRPTTYFNEDTALMFREAVHKAVVEAIDAVTSAQGVRGLSEEARRITFNPGKGT
jgi:hypothetical protein